MVSRQHVPPYPGEKAAFRTEGGNCSSRAREDAECANILLRKDILDGRDEGARGTGDEGRFDGGGDGVLRLVELLYLPLLRHDWRMKECVYGNSDRSRQRQGCHCSGELETEPELAWHE